jgi:hypothetical protein
MNFKKDNFTVLKNVISVEVANFIYKYFLLKRKVANTFYKEKYIPNNSPEWGTWNDPQVPNTYSHYADIAMETLLQDLKPIMESTTELQLVETYAYARIYKKGDILYRHKDRFSCEISTTLNLGGESWPIYIDPTGDNNIIKSKLTEKGIEPELKKEASKGIEVNLNPGDMLVYKGNILEHWREEFTGDNCAQVFLHYNNLATEGSDKNKFDGRGHLGLPSFFRK